MNCRSKGFTLVELMVVVIVIVAIAAAIFGFFGGFSADWQQAEAYAREYAKEVPGSTGRVSCMKKDSDDDGYCRCNIFMKKQRPVAVECGCEKRCINCAEGCSDIKPSVRVHNTNYNTE